MVAQRLLRAMACFGLCVGISLGFVPRASADLTFTGAVTYSANSDGSFFNREFSNTLGGDFALNLFVTQPNAGMTGPFLNSGNSLAARLNYGLTPGTYTFFTFNQPGPISGGNPTELRPQPVLQLQRHDPRHFRHRADECRAPLRRLFPPMPATAA